MTVYTLTGCPNCVLVKEFLDENEIEFEEIDVGENDTAAEEMIALTGQNSVPVTVIEDEFVIGFDEERLTELLNLTEAQEETPAEETAADADDSGSSDDGGCADCTVGTSTSSSGTATDANAGDEGEDAGSDDSTGTVAEDPVVVKVYTTNGCPYCTLVKGYLASQGIEFEEINAGTDPAAAQEMIDLTGQNSVPVTVVGDEFVIGYKVTQLEDLLDGIKKNQ